MGEPPVVLGLDFGTGSVRAVLVDAHSGELLGVGVQEYAHGEQGVVLDEADPHLARQVPQDYHSGTRDAVQAALAAAGSGFDPSRIQAIGVDTTGSTPLPVDAQNRPLTDDPRFAGNPHAMAWLWKDHTAIAEAEEITEKARSWPYLAKCGGIYSSEWFWAKALKCSRVAPEVIDAAASWVEIADYIPAWLTGVSDPAHIRRGACAAGHKAMWHRDWGGLPSREFLAELSPALADLRDRLYNRVFCATEAAGTLQVDIGLPTGISVAVGAFDAHLGAVGAGVAPGVLVKIMGTSTCDVMVAPDDGSVPDIPGLCGIAVDSVLPGMLGLEAGQSAVGDLFAWGAGKLSDGDHGRLQSQAAQLRPGESGLLALDWNNGNRTILVDQALTGLLVGQTLATDAADIYRSLIEATAFGALRIIERIEEYGVPVSAVVACGGIAEKSDLSMQIYADIFHRPISVAGSPQTCAVGSAIAASVAAGIHPSVSDAQAAMLQPASRTFTPEAGAAATYAELYAQYRRLHDAFGVLGTREDLSDVMKRLLAIARRARER
jgi:L-ribulokinase